MILRGLTNTLRMGALDLKHERSYGIDTGKFKRSDDSEYFHYQGAGYGITLKIFTDLVKGRENYHFIDIGSGKGRALIVAESCGFNKLTGIELHQDLVKSAEENLLRYQRRRNTSQVVFIQQNALHFNYHNEPAVYFMFNPFGENVLRQVLIKILQNTKSETFFIYMNPRFAKVFAELGIKKDRIYKTRFYTEAIIYRLPAEN